VHKTDSAQPAKTPARGSAKAQKEARREARGVPIEQIQREARADRCFSCYHTTCDCPPGKGLNGGQRG